jgi:hypothetical protein
LNLIGSTILAVLVLLTLFGNKRYALLAIMCGVLFLTQGQGIEVAGIQIYATRLLVLAGFSRAVVRNEFAQLQLTGIDTALVAAYGYTAFVYLLHGNGPPMTGVGKLVDSLLAYFTFRSLIDSEEMFRWFLKSFALALIPFSVLVAVEMFTERNPFSVMGGALEQWEFRGGRLRCMGSFRHPSLLGTLGAIFFPLYVWLAFFLKERFWGYMGIVSCVAIVYMSNSGGPLAALAVAAVCWIFWGVRHGMHIVRSMMFGSLVLIIVLMKAPIWYLPAKLSPITGGDGWHRSYLMDVAFSHIDEWWLAGMPILDTSDWFPYVVMTGGADLINYYLDFGIAGGFVAMVLFIFLLVRAFRHLGLALAAARVFELQDTRMEGLLWALGAVLTTHVFNWFGIVYFDQTYLLWFFHIAAISFFAHLSIRRLGDAAPQQMPGRPDI